MDNQNVCCFAAPLVKIKKVIAKIKAEIQNMDTRIGVLDCLLLQTKVKEKSALEDDLNQWTVIY